MALYSYKGIDGSGKEVKGTLNSDSLPNAKKWIRGRGIMLMEIVEERASSSATQRHTSSSLGFSTLFTPKIKINELSLMTRQLATLIKARIQIVEAFTALIDQTTHQQLKIILSEIKQRVNEGSSLAKALSDYPKVFNNVYVNMVEAGEASGTLDIVLLRLAEFTDAQVKLKNKIKGAMAYPVIMAVVGSILMGIIFTFVIPKITKIFVSMKRDLPLQTEICIWISDFIRNYWMAILPAGLASFYLFKKYIQTEKGRGRWHRFLLRMPKFGPLLVMINVGRFCSTLATLLNSGVPILVSLRIVKNLISNVHMRHALAEASDSVAEGASLTGPLVKSGLYPSLVTHMIRLGEKSGELASMLKIVAENYEEEVEHKLNNMTAMLGPIMMVCMGGVVGLIIFAVIAPMMELNSLR